MAILSVKEVVSGPTAAISTHMPPLNIRCITKPSGAVEGVGLQAIGIQLSLMTKEFTGVTVRL